MDKMTLEEEVLKALECIKKGKNFILEGGAGSGKTYSLISLINALIREIPDTSIVYITYTNNAIAEILSRIDNDNNILVSTIHQFIGLLLKNIKMK